MVQNIVHLKSQIQIITQKIIECRKESGQTQDDVADWIKVDRRKIIDFENGKRFDIELLCALCDRFSIELELNYEVF
ncbi:MAG: hypothetical protein V4549_17970 [Bacteroidota bacterium]